MFTRVTEFLKIYKDRRFFGNFDTSYQLLPNTIPSEYFNMEIKEIFYRHKVKTFDFSY